MVRPMIILFLLGALQGAVGWIMVASGLTGDAIYVKPTRLALHFIFALGLLCYTFWFALELMVPKNKLVQDNQVRRYLWIILTVFTLQLVYGALMAGHKAATVAPTWPDINGQMVPMGMMSSGNAFLDLLENKITIHFIHRGLAYLLLLLVILMSIRIAKIKGSLAFKRTRFIPLYLIILQMVLGIIAVLTSPTIIPNRWGTFEWMAQLHQLVAMFLLLSFVWLLYIVRRKRS